jgi:uncharacterized RDD family membrane protein YckC
MENRTKLIKSKRFFAFVFDIAFIVLLLFTLYMIIGLIFKIDSGNYQNIIFPPLLLIMIAYLFFGELIFKNTLGKYLTGIEVADAENLQRPASRSYIKRGILKIIFPVEGIVLLFSRSKKRLGDLWANTIVVNKENNQLKSAVRLIIGIASLIALLFCFRISMGLAVEKTDFYNVGIDHLKNSNEVKIAGLPKVVLHSSDAAYFIVAVSNENKDKYVKISLSKNVTGWNVNHIDFIKEHITGYSYGFNYTSSGQ